MNETMYRIRETGTTRYYTGGDLGHFADQHRYHASYSSLKVAKSVWTRHLKSRYKYQGPAPAVEVVPFTVTEIAGTATPI